MSTAAAIATAITFVWLGMVLAISFVEAPIKFSAPEVTLRIGLGIGRLVFRALNAIEAVCAVVIIAMIVWDVREGAMIPVLAGVAAAMLVIQLVAVRPALTRRSDAVLAAPDGEAGPRSNAHFFYVGFELVKVAALIWLGVALLML